MKLKGVISPDKALALRHRRQEGHRRAQAARGQGVRRRARRQRRLHAEPPGAREARRQSGQAAISRGRPAGGARRSRCWPAGSTRPRSRSACGLDLPDKSGLTMLVDQADFYKRAPFVTKLNVVTDDVAQTRARRTCKAVVRGIMMASRDFAANPGALGRRHGEGAAGLSSAPISKRWPRPTAAAGRRTADSNLDRSRLHHRHALQGPGLERPQADRPQGLDRHALRRRGARRQRHVASIDPVGR